MKFSVAVAREIALALNEAADRAMATGAHDFELDELVQTSANVRWDKLKPVLAAVKKPQLRVPDAAGKG